MFSSTLCLLMMTLVGCSMGCAPGATGPAGPPGRDGRDGGANRSAFTAVKNSTQTGILGDAVTFEESPTNINNHFDLATGKFTCVFPGIYVFTCNIGLFFLNDGENENNDVHISIVKNGDVIATAHARVGGFEQDFDTASTSAVLELGAGDQVWLQFATGDKVYSNDLKLTSFTGYLIN